MSSKVVNFLIFSIPSQCVTVTLLLELKTLNKPADKANNHCQSFIIISNRNDIQKENSKFISSLPRFLSLHF